MPKKNHALVDYYLQTKDNGSDVCEKKIDSLIEKLTKLVGEGNLYLTDPALVNVTGPFLTMANEFKQKMEEYAQDRNNVEKRDAVNSLAVTFRKNAEDFFNNPSKEKKEQYGLGKEKINVENSELTMLMHTQTASEYIKSIQNDPDTKPGTKSIAQIFAARIMANSDRGSKTKLVNTLVDPAEVEKLADKLTEDKTFAEFVKGYQFTLDDFRHGHGGVMEDAFKKYIHDLKPEDKADMDYKLLSRFNGGSNFFSYGEFIEKNKEVPGRKEMNLQYLDNMLDADLDGKVKASKLLAAHKLMEQNKPFSEATLNTEAEKYRKDPFFKLVMRDKHVLDATLKGDFNTVDKILVAREKEFNKYIEADQLNKKNIKEALEALRGEYDPRILENNREIRHLREDHFMDDDERNEKIHALYAKNESIQKKYLASRSPEYKAMVKAGEKLLEKMKDGDVTATDIARVINATLTYQDGKEGGSFFSSRNKRFDNSMALLGAVTYGSMDDLEKRYFNTQLDKVNKARGYEVGDANYYDQKKIMIDDRAPFKGGVVIDRNILEDREARGLEPVEPEGEEAIVDKSVEEEQYDEPDLLD